MQRDLVATLGAAGAAYVRFLYGLPFALVFWLIALSLHGTPPVFNAAVFAWTGGGGLCQIAATVLMLRAMRERAFVVVVAYTKTEPIYVALFGMGFLGEGVTLGTALAISIATAGVLILSWPAKSSGAEKAGWRPALLGLGSAGLFALSAICYRAGLSALGAPDFFVAATSVLALALTLQTIAILAGLLLFDRRLLLAIFRAWRPSLWAGFMGALASQLWFCAFALQSAARVRTLALIEILFAQLATRRLFRQHIRRREIFGMAIMLIGVAALLAA